MNAVTLALLAVMAIDAGDNAQADRHIQSAQDHSRTMARRERQLVEIASLIVSGAHERARGLAFEHGADFPGDDALLASLLRPASTPDQPTSAPSERSSGS